MISALKSSFQNVIRLQNKNAYDFHALYLSYLQGSGRKNEAFKHVLKLIKENSSNDENSTGNYDNDDNQNDDNSSYDNGNDNNDGNGHGNDHNADNHDGICHSPKGSGSVPKDSIEKNKNANKFKSNGFQNLFLCYFCRYRRKTQRKRLLAAALQWVKNDSGSLHSVEIGD